MTISLKKIDDDLFASDASAIVNPVNCVGVMGAGLAEKFMDRFPENFKAYKHACNRALLRPGNILPYPVSVGEGADLSGPAWVVNLATKDHWRNDSKVEWIAEGAKHLRKWAEENGIGKVACPALGSGLGKLDWDSVKKILVEEFQHSTVTLDLYPPKPAGYRSGRVQAAERDVGQNTGVRHRESSPVADNVLPQPVVRKGFKNLARKKI